jgi:hypothetical protein
MKIKKLAFFITTLMQFFMPFKTLLINFCVSFCSNTNIHGFSYMVQPSRWRIERLFWLLSIFTSLTLTGMLIRKLVLENRRNPTIIYTDQNVVHVTNILFPSVSISSGLILKTPLKNGIDYVAIKERLTNGSIGLGNFSMVELKRLQIASLIARDGFMGKFNVTIPTDDLVDRLHDFPSFWMFKNHDRMKKIADFVFGQWSEGFSVNFTEVLCPTGFCYTFNFPSDISEFYNLNG